MFKKPETQKRRQHDRYIYVIYDSKTDSYSEPSFAINDGDLTRQLVNMFQRDNAQDNKYYLNAEDYSIFCAGNYCYATGTIESSQLQHVVNMHELRHAADALRARDMQAAQMQTTQAAQVQAADQLGH